MKPANKQPQTHLISEKEYDAFLKVKNTINSCHTAAQLETASRFTDVYLKFCPQKYNELHWMKLTSLLAAKYREISTPKNEYKTIHFAFSIICLN